MDRKSPFDLYFREFPKNGILVPLFFLVFSAGCYFGIIERLSEKETFQDSQTLISAIDFHKSLLNGQDFFIEQVEEKEEEKKDEIFSDKSIDSVCFSFVSERFTYTIISSILHERNSLSIPHLPLYILFKNLKLDSVY